MFRCISSTIHYTTRLGFLPSVLSSVCRSQPHLLCFMSVSPTAFFPGPQLWRLKGERDRMLGRRMPERLGTSVSLSLASSSVSPPPPAPSPALAPGWLPSSGLQLLRSPWPSTQLSGLELVGPTLAVSSVEEHETDTSLVLSPPVTVSSPLGPRAEKGKFKVKFRACGELLYFSFVRSSF